MTSRSADCPAPDCEFSDVPSLVAAHVNGTEGPEHDWVRLPYDGPGEFLSAVREGDGDGSVETSAGDAFDDGATPTDAPERGSGGSGPSSIDTDPVFRAVEVARESASDVEDLDDLDVTELADLFVAFSVLASEAGNVRSDVREAIIDRVEEEDEIAGELGTVGRSMSTRRSLRNERAVRSALFRAGFDPRDAESFDPDLVGELIAEGDLDEDEVFEVTESDHVRRTDVNEEVFGER